MHSQGKTKKQLLEEVSELRQRVAAPEAADLERERAEEPLCGNPTILGEAERRALVTVQKRAEAALRESEERFKLFMDNSPAIAWMKNDEGRYVYVNKAYGRRIAARLEDRIGKTDFELWPAATAELFWKNDQEVLSGGRVVEVVEESITPNGKRSYCWNFKFPFQDSTGRRFVAGVGVDITERKQSEEALQKAHDELERRVQERTAELAKANEDLDIFRKFVEASSDGFGMADIDGRIVYVNPMLCRLLGEEKPEDAVGHSVFEYYPEDYVQRRSSHMLPALLQAGYWQAEQTVLPRRGQPLLVLQSAFLIRDESGSPFRIAAAIRDITERKQATLALQATLQRLYVILSSMYCGVLLVTDDGRIEFANQAYCDRFGLAESPADLVGLDTGDMIEKIKHAYLRPEEAVVRIREIVERGESVRGEELAMQDGRTCLRDFVPLDVHGKSHGRLWLYFDITERKLAEEALRQSEEKYRVLVETSPDGVLMTDLNGYVTFVSQQVLRYYGTCDAAEIIGHNPLGFIAEKDHQRFIHNLQRTLHEGINRDLEYTFLKKDGTSMDCEVSAAVTRDASGKPNGQVAILRDITERTKTQAALALAHAELEQAKRAAETAYQTLFQNANDAVLLLQNDVFSDCNPMATQVYGYAREEMIGRSPADLSPARQPDGRDSKEAALEKIRAALEGRPQFFAWTHRRANGTPLTTEVSLSRMEACSQPTLLAIVRDVTERKKAEESLRQLSRAVEQSPVNVVITDIDGNIEYVNPRFSQLTGYTMAEVLGKNPRVLKSGHTSDDEYRVLWQTIKSGGEWSGEFLNKAKNGSLYWERARISSIKDESGRITHFLSVKEDITERKRAEEAMQQMQMQLTHVARLSTLGEMVAELAHELNHPIYAILNYAKASRNVLSEEGPPDLDCLREWNEEIADIALSAGAVIKRLRSFARRAESPRDARHIEEIVKEALGLVDAELRRARVTVRTFFAAESPPIQVDRVQIQQVLVNLLSNALEAMETSPADKRRITIRTSLRDALVEVSVSDRGVGLPPESETKIFEPFTSTKPDGLGVGLSIARTIVESHGGQLWATPNRGGVAVFHFTLPLDAEGRPDDL